MSPNRFLKRKSQYAGEMIKHRRFGYYAGFIIDVEPSKPMPYIPFSRKNISCQLYSSVTYSNPDGTQDTIDYDLFRQCFLIFHNGRWKSI